MITACSKWILSGEHTVIRGGQAIAFPSFEYFMHLEAEKSDRLEIITNATKKSHYIKTVIQNVMKFLNIEKLNYKFIIDSNIPISSGFGSSAALSVLMAKWFKNNGLYENSLKLALFIDNIFHSGGSGLDVNVIFHEKPILYSIKSGITLLNTKFYPKIKLLSVPARYSTKKCIKQVNKIMVHNPELGTSLDERMNEATSMCLEALNKSDTYLLANAINQANTCFHEWGLHTKESINLIDKLISEGAIAAKPIGSGGGGGVLALFE